MNDAVRLPIAERSQVGEARRAAVALAQRLGFDETEAGKVALVVTEMASNLVKHARGGEILLHALPAPQVTGGTTQTAGIDVLSLDRGPGLDLDRCLRDGYSTAGTPGTGLGAIRRLSAFFDLYSSPASGTALLARLWSGPTPSNATADGLETGAISLPVAGETECGDAWATERDSARHLFLVADGLGHGPLAATAAREAVRVFHDRAGLEPGPILQAIHAALRSTRGAAVSLAAIDFAAQEVCYVGVGNVSGTVVSSGGIRSMVSHNGIVGHQLHKVQEFVYPFPPDAVLVMHSDGLTGHWRLDQYPGLFGRDPGVIAGVLFRDCRRGRDDVTVLVARAT